VIASLIENRVIGLLKIAELRKATRSLLLLKDATKDLRTGLDACIIAEEPAIEVACNVTAPFTQAG